ncbi:MAG: S-methyl-5-thioribose-1-phosphate isomerase [Pseudomonadota bacterium]|nr:S-methyl-5-thioribose-1-phosphate isomerase [Pseudomonadota bacterium]
MNRSSLSLRYAARDSGGALTILDQQALPDTERWLEADTVDAMIGHLHALRVRGAPLIGVAAALCLARLADTGVNARALADAARRLRAARPTAVNLMWAMDRMTGIIEAHASGGAASLAARVEAEAVAIFDEDVALCDAMAAHGAALIADGEGILTHCNTGGLATAGIGTALGVLRRAWESGKRLHVWVDETRPLLQGGRLTTYELGRLGIPHTLITDSMAAMVMRSGQIHRVLVGADRIAANGDFANKVGTYGVAVLAAHHGIPFHPVAPWSTVDLATRDGAAIPIEERDPAEVRGVVGSLGSLRWAPAEAPVFNPAFDVTPAALVTSIVLDTGVVTGAELQRGNLANHAPAGTAGGPR